MSRTYYLFYLVLILFLLLQSCKKEEQFCNCDLTNPIINIDSLKIGNKILIIGIDGFRSDAMTEDITPFIYNLINRNNYNNFSHLTEEDTYSGPNWSSILTGVHFNKHNVTDNSFEGSRFDLFPNVFHYIEQNLNPINTVSIVNWTPINQEVLSVNVDYNPDNSINDSMVFRSTMNILKENNPLKGDVIFIHFDELDAAGHNFGFSPNIPEYKETLKTLDTYVDSLISTIDNKRDNGENWMCILISDHGGDGTGHGDYSNPKIRETMFIAEHPLINFNENHQSNQTDIAPTILKFLGISSQIFDCKTDGNSIIKEN